jgi:hypothetical protein
LTVVAEEKGKGNITESNAIAIFEKQTPMHRFSIDERAIRAFEVNQVKTLVLTY